MINISIFFNCYFFLLKKLKICLFKIFYNLSKLLKNNQKKKIITLYTNYTNNFINIRIVYKHILCDFLKFVLNENTFLYYSLTSKAFFIKKIIYFKRMNF